MGEKAILFDTSRCTGCHACQVSCKCWNLQPSPIGLNENKFSGTHQNPPDLNGNTRLIMTYHENEGGSKGVQWAFGRRACQHCSTAPCANICPQGALYVHEDTGFVTFDDSKCVGCQYCSTACPFDVPHYWTEGFGELRYVINKCSGCIDRVEHGRSPACVTTCQPEALNYGDRDEMIERAHERLENLKNWGYEDAVIYGENEMGGLHVIQVLKYGVEAHGQVENPDTSAVTWWTNFMKPFTGVITGIVVVAFAAMLGLNRGYRHRQMVYNEETKDTLNVQTGDIVKKGDGPDEETVVEHVMEALDSFMGKGGKDE